MRTIFFPAKYKEASRQISIETPADARASVQWLNEQWRGATRTKKVRLKKYAVLAMNRARALLKRKNLSLKERKQLKRVITIYKRWISSHQIK